VRLFITHGGLLSSIETVYFGVPILVIPIYGDQKLNAQLAIGNSYGLSLSYDELNEENLFQKLNELIENPK
jgi:UDP:flavonoid glycosyltransferase YjiC (YdhE family)